MRLGGRVKLDEEELHERVEQNLIHARIDSAGVVEITTHVVRKGWLPVSRASLAYIVKRLANGEYRLVALNWRGMYAVEKVI